jgi:glycerol uptake facilitator-like aquaporin
VGAYIGAAYWFTSSTSFANPAITVGRMFSNSFAGIAPSSVPSFVGAQIVGGLLAVGLIRVFYPGVTPAEAATVVIPHHRSRDELVDPQTNDSTGSPDPNSSDHAERPASPLPPTSER